MKHTARPARRRSQAAPAADLPAGLPPGLPEDPMLAAAVLLPLLEAEAAAGHGPSRLAASLIRQLATAPAGAAPPPAEALEAAVARLLHLVRQQDRHLARLHAMLDALL